MSAVASVKVRGPAAEFGRLDGHSTYPAMSDHLRREATSYEVEAALQALEIAPVRIRVRDWPVGLVGLDSPGLYSWWADDKGPRDLELGLGLPIPGSRIYGGQAGATQWLKSGLAKTRKVTLRSRIGTHHLGLRSDYSTLRHTIAGPLRRQLNLATIGKNRLDRSSEERLRDWMRKHLVIAVHPFANRDVLKDLEEKVLKRLDPPLNLRGFPREGVRKRLSALRAAIWDNEGPDFLCEDAAQPKR